VKVKSLLADIRDDLIARITEAERASMERVMSATWPGWGP